MAEKPANVALQVVPAEKPKASPYANTTFTFGHSPYDVTIVFLQAPLFDDEDVVKIAAEAAKGGQVKVTGAVVASVTMPRMTALDLGRRLVEMLGGEKVK